MTTDRKTHWLRTNEANRIPRQIVCLDTEAYLHGRGNGSRHEFRCGVASLDRLSSTAEPLGETAWVQTEDPFALWKWIAYRTSSSYRTVAFAHNLGYDLRLSNALTFLPQLGFRCKGIALTPYSCWARFHDGKRSLMLVDSLSYIPVSLERIAHALGIEKPPLPSSDDSMGVWLDRCRGDVEATRLAVLRLLRWFREADLGDFRATGPGQAMAAFRHRFMPPRSILIHNDTDALAAERRAVWAGRCEVWRHGKTKEEVCEYDFAAAYAHIGRDYSLPCALVSTHGSAPTSRVIKAAAKYAVLAEVDIETEAPTVPTEKDGRILWPIGRFTTTLWDPELQLAIQEGAKIRVRRSWRYKRAPILLDWGSWILDLLSGSNEGSDPLLRYTIKDWSRSLIGRFGLRYAEWDPIAYLPTQDVSLYGCSQANGEPATTYLQLGNDLFDQTGLVESSNSSPAIMGYVMSVARVKLWEAMKLAGFGNFHYVDTDGIILPWAPAQQLESLWGRGNVPPLRRKDSFASADFRGPRNIDLGEMRRVNGAPRRSERLAHSVYRGEIWESLPMALRHHRPGSVFVHNRTFRISDEDPRRVHLPDGRTEAVRIG